MFSDVVMKWLESALDCGIKEVDFWNMTLAEIERAVKSKQRVMKREAQERASADYILGDLIGRSIARIYNSSARYPDIYTAYPTLFDSKQLEEKKRAQKEELSVLRFKQFAQSYNKRFKEVLKEN